MKVFVLGGFLGSGKTSILLQLADFLRAKGPKTEKPSLIILENEIGAEGIDDKIIEANGYLVETLVSGCVCCTMIGELIYCLNKIATHLDPEWLIIEATGMANTTTVVRTIERRVEGLFSVSSLIVVDAERYDDIVALMPGFLRGQIANADTVFLNKIDLLTPKQIEEASGKIRGINQNALFFPVSAHCEIDGAVWKKVVEQNEQLTFS